MKKRSLIWFLLIPLIVSFVQVAQEPGAADLEDPYPIEIYSYIDYGDEESVSFEFISDYSGEVVIPDVIDVVSGEPEETWLELQVGDRKFCYQGNALKSEDSSFGDSFFLEYELENVSGICGEDGFPIEDVERVVFLEYGDVVISEMYGVDQVLDGLVEVEFELIPID